MELVPDFDEWYGREYRTVLTAAVLLSRGDRSVAEDATSEAFVRALLKWDRVSRMSSPVGWTIRVAKNRVRANHRAWVRRASRERRHQQLTPSNVETELFGSSDVWDAVERLTDKQRDALVLRYVHGASQAEAAALLGVAPGTVAATLHQARARLRTELSNDRSKP